MSTSTAVLPQETLRNTYELILRQLGFRVSDRNVEILQAMAKRGRFLVSEICEDTGYRNKFIYAFLKELDSFGVVTHDPEPKIPEAWAMLGKAALAKRKREAGVLGPRYHQLDFIKLAYLRAR
jgi:hypothetical protein